MYIVLAILVLIAAILAIACFATTQTPRRSRNRRGLDQSLVRLPTDAVATLAVITAKLRVTLSAPCSVVGLPLITASGGSHSGIESPTAISIASPTEFTLTYTGPIATGDSIQIGPRVAAVRTDTGGYIVAQTKTL